MSAAALSKPTFSKAHIALALLICFYLVDGISYLQYQTLTSDEGDFYNYAVRFLKGHPERIHPAADNSKMPVAVLNTLPRITTQLLHSVEKNDGGFSDIMHGRYVTLAFSVFTMLLVFRWAKELYGNRAGVFAAFLFSICPNNLANAGLVTTDAYSVFFLVATFYWLWRFCLQGGHNNFLLLTLFVAVSQLVKQSLFHLYVLIPLCTAVYFSTHRERLSVKNILYGAIVFLLINWLVINAGFYFCKTAQPIGSYHFMSQFFGHLQNWLPAWLPVPLPQPFVEGLDQAKYYDQVGGGYSYSSFGNVTILGQTRTGAGFWYYYLITLLFKTPISFLVLFFWALWLHVKSKVSFRNDSFFLLLPVCYYLFLFSFFYKTQCGLRHLIFIYPFLFIFSSQILVYLHSAVAKAAVVVLSIYAFVSVLLYWKNYYPYTNEFILNKTEAYKVVGAANLEFLQGGNFLMQYLKQHPDVKLAPKKLQRGLFAISLREYMDVWNQHEYDWIRQYPPVGNIACTYLLIKVP